MSPPGHTDTAEMITALRRRGSELGMPSWRLDSGGLITEEPFEPGTAGLWLRSGAVGRLVQSAGAGWNAPDAPQAIQAFPGCWVIGIAEMRRGLRVGQTVFMALSQDALHADEFVAGCVSAQVDPAAARRALRELARFEAGSIPALARCIEWMRHDQNRIAEDSTSIAGFTRQLTDCFETIDLLYTMGRSMTDLDAPEKFIRAACDRLNGTTAFRWHAIEFDREADIHEGLRGVRVSVGTPAGDAEQLGRTMGSLLARVRKSATPAIVGGTDAAMPDQWAQVVVQPVLRGGRSVGVLAAGDKQGEDAHVSSYDTRLLEAAAGFLSSFVQNVTLYAEQRALFLGTLDALTASIDAKDRYTAGHSRRVAHLACRLALAAGLDEHTAERVRISGLVHDVGKIGVPEAVLCKTGRLTDEEFALIKTHPEIGHRILKDIPHFDDVLPGVLHHHERWDGRGYPAGLAGEQIPLVARILALADTFDAMSSNRSYRPALPRDRVLEDFRKCAGTQFDPALVERFVALDFTEFDRMVAEARGLGFGPAANDAARAAA